jgi:probable rRNA maturation factor
MTEHASQVELFIDLGNDESNTALLHLLSSLPLEAVVNQTLQIAAITQPVTLTLLITSDEAIRNLNKQYRGQDKPTDVLSFPLLEKPIVNAPADQLWMPPETLNREIARRGSTKQVFITPAELTTNLGDIVISWPTLVRQAAGAGHNPTYELLYLLSHGVLHLIGYDDQTEAGYQAMVRIQQAVMEATEEKA